MIVKMLSHLLFFFALPLLSHAAECEEGSVSAYASGEAAMVYGAESRDVCSEFCIPEIAISFLPNAQAGACMEQGYTVQVGSSQEVTITGSPMPISVSLYRTEAAEEPTSDCEEGSVSAYATGEAAETYGAESSDLCSEFCIPEMALGFLPNAQAGSCVNQGFSMEVMSAREVTIPGSPMPLMVTVYKKEAPTDAGVDAWDYPNPSSFEGPCVDCPEYVALSGKEKLDRIWSKITAYEYAELPTNWLHKRTNPTVTEVIDSFPDKSRVNMIFDRVSDERPPNFPRVLHEYGSIAKIAFEPTLGNKFTGLYSEGNDFGIIRVTFCAPFSGEMTGSRVPLAFAAKFFRDGIHSSNIPVCEGPDRDWRGRDPMGFSVFQHALHTSSIIPPPIDVFFANAQNGTGPLSIADNTWYTQDGSKVEDPLSPLIVHFFPNTALNTKDAYEEDFRQELPELPVNTTLYTAYTPVDDEGNPTICICHSTPEGDIPCFNRESLAGKCNLVELGSIVSKSQFIASNYGDNGVLFKHYRSCQEDRKYCKYNKPVPEIDRIFTKSSNPNGTCVSRRRVDNYDTCPFLGSANAVIEGLELLGSEDYCSTPDEHELEKMCPFANALHPSFSANSVSYPITTDQHLRTCGILNDANSSATSTSTAVTTKSDLESIPVVSIACCRVINEYFDEATQELALQSLCNMNDCKAEFEKTFFEVELDAKCANVDPVSACQFDLQAGPNTIPMNLGFVTDECCAAIQSHAADGVDTSLRVVCDDMGCVMAYESLFQQGQTFANPGASTETLQGTCSSMDESTQMEDPTPSPTERVNTDGMTSSPTIDNASGAVRSGTFSAALFASILYLMVS